VQYGTDASKMERAGVQCVVFGPGDIAQAHTAVEWVEVGQVETAVEVYARILTGRQG
jgi:acetylornithine deacetylase